MSEEDEVSEQRGSKHITLDRTNLRRLVSALAVESESLASDPGVPALFAVGWKAAVDALDAMADLMPDLYGDDGCPVFTQPE